MGGDLSICSRSALLANPKMNLRDHDFHHKFKLKAKFLPGDIEPLT
jgi:hypothetical protein